MKKLILTTALIAISYLGFSQVTPSAQFRIADATTAFGVNLPVGTQVYDVANDKLYDVKAGIISTATITTAAASLSLVNAGGTVTSVTSADGNATVATTTTTPVITIVSAPKLTTARTINGTSFDGTANITVTVDANTLTGTTLNSTVVNSSLTSVGTLTNLTVTNPIAGSVTGNAATVTTNANLTGPITSVGNATTITAGAVTYAKLQNESASTILGNPTGSAAAPSEITLGTGLSFTGSVLNTTNGVTFFSEAFEQALVPSTFTLAHTPKNQATGGVTVELNGLTLKQTEFSVAAGVLTVTVPTAQFDRVVVSYNF